VRNAHLERRAREDVRRLVQMIIQEFQPKRIYQWGSLTRQGTFREFSDIDLAVEGVTEPELFFKMLGRCMELTDFPVDLVQLECIEPLHADEIRTRGRLLWENPSCPP
jgi:predicted nucleotidyltransferase